MRRRRRLPVGGRRLGASTESAGAELPETVWRDGLTMCGVWPYIQTLLPSIGLLYLLYVILKHMMEGDRRERIAHAEWEKEQAELARRKDHGGSHS